MLESFYAATTLVLKTFYDHFGTTTLALGNLLDSFRPKPLWSSKPDRFIFGRNYSGIEQLPEFYIAETSWVLKTLRSHFPE